MTQISIKDLLDVGEAHARRVLIEDHEERLTTFYHLSVPDGPDAIIPCSWRNQAEKEITAEVVAQISRKMGATAALFVTEAWMVRLDPDQSEDYLRHGAKEPPSEDPRRIEVVICVATDGHKSLSRMLRMVRDKPGGTLVSLEREDTGEEEATLEGRMITNIILYHHNANTHWNYPTSAETDNALTLARESFANFFNASPREVAFGNNMTTITFHISRALGRKWGPGDEIVVTELDHHANVAPWRELAKERGITIRSVPFDVITGELAWDELERAVTEKTRLVAIGAASNALGTVSPVRDAAKLAHAKGALCFVDAVHFAAHRVIDVKEMECDFLVCSPYKFYGPHAGVLFARADVMSALDVPKLEPASNEIPERVETGTQNHEGIVGSAAAVEFLASLATGNTPRERLVRAMSALHARGEALFARLWEGLTAVNGVRCYGPPQGSPRTPTVSFTVAGVASAQVAKLLAREALFASNGNFYAASVVARLGQAREGLVRAGCACYTTEEEIDRLVESVRKIAAR